jgi:hypothetical protein
LESNYTQSAPTPPPELAIDPVLSSSSLSPVDISLDAFIAAGESNSPLPSASVSSDMFYSFPDITIPADNAGLVNNFPSAFNFQYQEPLCRPTEELLGPHRSPSFSFESHSTSDEKSAFPFSLGMAQPFAELTSSGTLSHKFLNQKSFESKKSNMKSNTTSTSAVTSNNSSSSHSLSFCSPVRIIPMNDGHLVELVLNIISKYFW